MTMLRKCRAARTVGGGPMLVHCSAGVGRTGTLIAIDINLDRVLEEETVDIYGTLNLMRRERNTMVQTEEQYIFIYRSMADAIANVMTEIPAAELATHFKELYLVDRDGLLPLHLALKNGAPYFKA